MRVQRVVMPWDAVSWTVLEDDGNPVGAVDRFLGFLSSSEKSPNTVKSYAHDLKDWFSYLSGRGLAWDEVTLEDVAAFVAWLRLPPQGRDGTVAVLGEQAHHCGASTVNRKLAAVASFYRFHARHGAKAVGVLRVIQAPGRGYTGTAFRPFLHHVTGRSPRPRLAVKVKAPRPLPRAPQSSASDGLGRQARAFGVWRQAAPGQRLAWQRAAPGHEDGQDRHLMEQPMLGRCGSGTGWPARVSSMAARSSSPVTGLPLPGVDWSNAPR